MPSPNKSISRGIDRVWDLVPWLGLLLGTVLVESALRHPASGPISPTLQFWLGLFLGYLPAFWRILSMGAARGHRAALLAIIALFSLLPRLFACPEYFCTFEELGWWRAVQNLAAGSGVLATPPLGAARGVYPALPVVTNLLQETAGLSIFQTGLVLAAVFRVVTLLSVFLLGERIFLSARAGASAALVLFLYPGFYQADGFTSDRMGLALVVPALLVAGYLAERNEQEKNLAWRFLALILILTTTLTHPSSALVLALILGSMALATRLRSTQADQESALRLGQLCGLAFLAAAAWLLTTSPALLSAKAAWLRAGLNAGQAAGPVQLAGVQAVSALAPALLLLLLALAGARLIRRLGLPVLPAAYGLFSSGAGALAGVVFLKLRGEPTTPSVHTALFTAVALLAGVGLAWLTAPKRSGERRSTRAARQFIALAVMAIVLGAVSVPVAPARSSLEANLYPTSAFNSENVSAARWMLAQAGPGNRILGDKASLRVFGSLGMQSPVWQADPRAWEALSTVSAPLQTLLWLTVSNAAYLVMDRRQNDVLDLTATTRTFRQANADIPTGAMPTAPAGKMDAAPLLARVYDSGSVRIYYLPLGSAGPVKPRVEAPGPAPTDHATLAPARAWPTLPVLAFLPGFLLTLVLFPGRKDIDGLTRGMLAVILSISLIALLGTMAGLLFRGTAGADELVWVATLLLTALALHIQGPEAVRRWMRALTVTRPRPGLADVPVVAAVACFTGLALTLLTGSAPTVAPVTRFSLDLSSPLSVQIANQEEYTTRYEVIAAVDGKQVWRSGAFEVRAGEEIGLDVGDHLPARAQNTRVDLTLYKNHQSDPYRSLHLTLQTPKEHTQTVLPSNGR